MECVPSASGTELELGGEGRRTYLSLFGRRDHSEHTVQCGQSMEYGHGGQCWESVKEADPKGR